MPNIQQKNAFGRFAPINLDCGTHSWISLDCFLVNKSRSWVVGQPCNRNFSLCSLIAANSLIHYDRNIRMICLNLSCYTLSTYFTGWIVLTSKCSYCSFEFWLWKKKTRKTSNSATSIYWMYYTSSTSTARSNE